MENFPKIDIFPKTMRVARFLGRLAGYLPVRAPNHMSGHNHAPTAPPEPEQLRFSYDDMGGYYNGDLPASFIDWREHHTSDQIYPLDWPTKV